MRAARNSKLPAAELEALDAAEEAEDADNQQQQDKKKSSKKNKSSNPGDDNTTAANKSKTKKSKRGRKQQEGEGEEGDADADADEEGSHTTSSKGAARAQLRALLEAEVDEAQWRRSAALRRSRMALLAEMGVWEREAEEKEAAAAAGIVSSDLLGDGGRGGVEWLSG